MSIGRDELKHIKSLRTRKGRREQGRFAAEGVRLLEEAVRHRFRPQAVYFTQNALSERGRRLVSELGSLGAALQEVSVRQLTAIADTTTPQGVLAVFKSPPCALGELMKPRYRKLLWCESVSDPGNLGTLLRSALAFEFDMAVVSGVSAEVYSPKVIRASMGALFALPVARASVAETMAICRSMKVRIIAGVPAGESAAAKLTRRLARRPLILAIGSESRGLPSDITSEAEIRVRVQHSPLVDSLNAAVAGSILMNHLYRVSRN